MQQQLPFMIGWLALQENAFPPIGTYLMAARSERSGAVIGKLGIPSQFFRLYPIFFEWTIAFARSLECAASAALRRAKKPSSRPGRRKMIRFECSGNRAGKVRQSPQRCLPH